MKSLLFNFICLPVGLTSKLNRGWRQIYYFSYLLGCSVNDHISPEWKALKYPTFNNAVSKIVTYGPDYVLVKQDLTDVF